MRLTVKTRDEEGGTAQASHRAARFGAEFDA